MQIGLKKYGLLGDVGGNNKKRLKKMSSMVSAQLFNNKITLQENFHIQFWYFKRILYRFPGWRSLVVLAKKLLKSLISARRPSWQVNQLVSRILADKPNWALALHIQYTYKQIHAFLSTSLEKHYILQRNGPSIRFGGVIPNFFFFLLLLLALTDLKMKC